MRTELISSGIKKLRSTWPSVGAHIHRNVIDRNRQIDAWSKFSRARNPGCHCRPAGLGDDQLSTARSASADRELNACGASTADIPFARRTNPRCANLDEMNLRAQTRA